jgi:hypothetical protein
LFCCWVDCKLVSFSARAEAIECDMMCGVLRRSSCERWSLSGVWRR